jgi:hypothetical protein
MPVAMARTSPGKPAPLPMSVADSTGGEERDELQRIQDVTIPDAARVVAGNQVDVTIPIEQ